MTYFKRLLPYVIVFIIATFLWGSLFYFAHVPLWGAIIIGIASSIAFKIWRMADNLN